MGLLGSSGVSVDALRDYYCRRLVEDTAAFKENNARKISDTQSCNQLVERGNVHPQERPRSHFIAPSIDKSEKVEEKVKSKIESLNVRHDIIKAIIRG